MIDAAQYRNLSLFQKVLLATDGTVTDLLKLYVGADVRARKISQNLAARHQLGPIPAAFRVPAETLLLQREIVLEASHADRAEALVHATSFFVFGRFSRAIQTALLESDVPIGTLWRNERLEMYREVVEQAIERRADVAVHLGLPIDTPLVTRAYVIYHQAMPLGLITERFALNAFRDHP
jgi:chorismate-pyruvate lyase